MNLYLRYFDSEILVHTVDEAIDFLAGIEEIGMDAALEQDIRQYAESDIYYPKRYKIRPRVYFIVIKTEAATMEDFKNKKALRTPSENGDKPQIAPALARLNEQREGWYEGIVDFKRVLLVPGTGKFEYRDTRFVARCKAMSVWIATTASSTTCVRGLTPAVSSPHLRERISSLNILEHFNSIAI